MSVLEKGVPELVSSVDSSRHFSGWFSWKGMFEGTAGLRAWWGGQRSRWKLLKATRQTLRPALRTPSLCPGTAHSCQESSWLPAAHPDPGH